jgi:type IX secretion system PorP/SprF family membrane protein
MKALKNILLLLFGCVLGENLLAQDPSFSQFFSSPLNVNPALTGVINGKWRVISNYRNQWSGPTNPYATGTISIDDKILQNNVENYVDEITRIGIGGMMMYDQGMGGALKSNFASLNISGNVRLASSPGYEPDGNRIQHLSKIKMEERSAEHRLGIGLGVSYGKKWLDATRLTFGEQFTGSGFDANMPTGETALSNMKPFLSVNAGLLYSCIMDNSNFDFGVAAFHLNRPRQTFLEDDKVVLPARYVIHSNFETLLTDQVILNTNGIYQYQSGASYFSIGGALGYYLSAGDETNMIINAGAWYWSNNAIVPYIGFGYGNFQLGITYDITVSDLKSAPQRVQTFELCLIWRRSGSKSDGVIPSPWR